MLEGKEPNAHPGISEMDREDFVRLFALSDTTGSASFLDVVDQQGTGLGLTDNCDQTQISSVQSSPKLD